MGWTREELLRPSLTGLSLAAAPHSVQTVFLSTFFGGPFAAIGMIGVNAVRLRRWRDFAILGLVLATVLGFVCALHLTAWGSGIRAAFSVLGGQVTLSLPMRVIGMAIFVMGYFLHRSEQRSADFMGLRRPNGIFAGVALIAVGITAESFLDIFLGNVPPK